MILKEFITMYQRPGGPLPSPGTPEYQFILEAAKKSNTYIFPEYFTFLSERTPEESWHDSLVAFEKLLEFSLLPEFSDTLLVGGTLIAKFEDKFFNSCPVILNGKLIYWYRKRTLFKLENRYLTPGNDDLIFTHPVTKTETGILICADILNPETFRTYAGASHIIIPVASPFRPEDTEADQNLRDTSIFLNASKTTGAIIFKCCLSPRKSGEKFHVQGRSLIATPENVIFRAPDITWRGHILYSVQSGNVETREFQDEI